MLSDIASPAVADGKMGETAKVQKGIIKDFLHGANDPYPGRFRFRVA
jgi:hypothetical protein